MQGVLVDIIPFKKVQRMLKPLSYHYCGQNTTNLINKLFVRKG